MITGNFPLTDEEVLELQSQTQAYHNRATDYHDGEIATRARLGYEYYYKELPKPINKGSSKYVSGDVWDGVNGVLQELISTFASNNERSVKFIPIDYTDGIGAEAATELVNKAMLQDNPGYNVLSESFKESLVTRNGWIKAYWKETSHQVIEEFYDMTQVELDQYLGRIEGEIIRLDTETVKAEKITKKGKKTEVEDGGEKLKGRVVYEVKDEGVKVEYIPFEEVVVDPTARSLCEASYICHRVRKEKADLLKMGFDPEKIATLPATALDIEGSGVNYARSNGLSPRATLDGISTGDKKADRVWLYEAYIKSSVGSEDAVMLQVFSCNGEILEVNQVNEQPFYTFSPFPTPGSVWGESVFDILKEVQDLKTNLRRGILDNIMNANFRRYIGVKGKFNRESLQMNRPGGVIEVNENIGDLQPFQHHQIPNGVTDMLEMLEYDKESRTGLSKAGQGLDPNVFKNDNSTATVGMVMTQAQNRLRMVARNIANYGLIPLYKGIYNLYRINGKKPIVVETSKGPVQIDPRMLPERNKMTVSAAVGANEKAERAAKLQATLMMFSQIPEVKPFFQANNAFSLVKDILECQGFGNVIDYLTPPDQIPPAQPDPMQQAQLALMQKQIDNLETQNQKLVHDVQMAQQKLDFEQQKAADEMHNKLELSKSQQDNMADQIRVQERSNEIASERNQLDNRKLDLKEREMMIQAQLENGQQRPISLRG